MSDDSTSQTLWGMIANVYGRLDAEDCARIDREWMKFRGMNIDYLPRYRDDDTGMQPHESGEWLRREDVLKALGGGE